jgi:hypothetical protein
MYSSCRLLMIIFMRCQIGPQEMAEIPMAIERAAVR